eukprot:684446-Hanusia_phi.AAC.2
MSAAAPRCAGELGPVSRPVSVLRTPSEEVAWVAGSEEDSLPLSETWKRAPAAPGRPYRQAASVRSGSLASAEFQR